MRHKILITMIAIFCLLAVPLWAQQNNYAKVDRGLRMVYKQVTGTSLKDAIDSLLAEQPDSLYDSTSQVEETPRAKRNCPSLKSLDSNLIYIPDGASEDSDAPIDIDQFVVPGKNGTYDIPIRFGFIGKIEDINRLGVGNIDHISKSVLSTTLPLNILPHLCQLRGLQYIRPGPRATLESNKAIDEIESMRPNDQRNLKNNYRKADYALRLVYKQVTGQSLEEAIDSLIAEQPDSLYDSTSQVDENPPPRRSCPPPKSSHPGLVYIPNDSITPAVELSDYKISNGKAGTHYVSAAMGFVGNIDDLKMFSSGDIRPYSRTTFGFVLILEKLPELCQIKGLQYIKIQPQPTLE